MDDKPKYPANEAAAAHDNGDTALENEVEDAFEELENQGSGVRKAEISLRLTLPDIDGVILATAAKIAKESTNPESSVQDTGPNDCAPDAPTIPPSIGYENLVACTKAEEDLRALRETSLNLPRIEVDEPALTEKLFIDPDFVEAYRVVTLLNESGVDTESEIIRLEKAIRDKDLDLSADRINQIIVTHFGNLARAILELLGKKASGADAFYLKEAAGFLTPENRQARKNDKAFLLSLRIVLKLCELYAARHDIGEDFEVGLLLKGENDPV